MTAESTFLYPFFLLIECLMLTYNSFACIPPFILTLHHESGLPFPENPSVLLTYPFFTTSALHSSNAAIKSVSFSLLCHSTIHTTCISHLIHNFTGLILPSCYSTCCILQHAMSNAVPCSTSMSLINTSVIRILFLKLFSLHLKAHFFLS